MNQTTYILECKDDISKSLSLYNNFTEDTLDLIKIPTLKDIGLFYLIEEDYDKSLEFLIQAEQLCKSEDIVLLELLASAYVHTKQYKKAIFCYEIIENDNSYMIDDFDAKLGDLYWKIYDFDNALKYYLKALEIPTDSDNLILICISEIYYQQKEYIKSIEFIKKSLTKQFSKEESNAMLELSIDIQELNEIKYKQIGFSYLYLNDFINANYYFNKCQNLLKNNKEDIYTIIQIYTENNQMDLANVFSKQYLLYL